MKRKKRIRIDRILLSLAIIFLIIYLIILGIESLINLNIHNKVVKNNTLSVRKKINVSTKTINYINEKVDEITIKKGNTYFTLLGSSIKNDMEIEYKSENKKVNEGSFKNQKGLYINKTLVLEKTLKLKVKLPSYLASNGEVDVYGIRNGRYTLYRNKVSVDKKYVTFNLNNIYDEYFITYIPLDSINTNTNIKVNVGDEIRPSLTYIPSNATNKSINYIESKKLLEIKGSTIIAKKKGTTVLTIKNKKNNISTDIKITIEEKKKVVPKEETPKEEKIEVVNKDGLYYIGDMLIVNKSYPLPSSYNPGSLTDDFMNAFYEMQAAAELDGIELWIQSGFRDYELQNNLYNNYVSQDGKEEADRYSARAGYSEHQSGLAADINDPSDAFNNTKEAKWLKDNCYKYGFIIRYPEGKEESTGYRYESWHVRYLGKTLAEEITKSGKTVEEYYNITSIYSN